MRCHPSYAVLSPHLRYDFGWMRRDGCPKRGRSFEAPLSLDPKVIIVPDSGVVRNPNVIHRMMQIIRTQVPLYRDLPDRIAKRLARYEGEFRGRNGDAWLLGEIDEVFDGPLFQWIHYAYRYADGPPGQMAHQNVAERYQLIAIYIRLSWPDAYAALHIGP